MCQIQVRHLKRAHFKISSSKTMHHSRTIEILRTQEGNALKVKFKVALLYIYIYKLY